MAGSRAAQRVPALAAPLRLASASSRRADILRAAGFDFAVKSAQIDEARLHSRTDPEAVALDLAKAKAAAVAGREREHVVLAADTVVVLDAEILGKPGSEAQAAEMLRRLRGRSHLVITGVAIDGICGRASGAETTRVEFRELSDGEIDRYVATGSPFDKAGGYGIQDEGLAPAQSVSGCYLNVVGLPMCLAMRLLGRAGAIAPEAAAAVTCPGHLPAGVPA